jgi:hypothetical protein
MEISFVILVLISRHVIILAVCVLGLERPALPCTEEKLAVCVG